MILAAVWLAAPSAARAQLGTGGVTGGTTGGTLTATDMFLSVQRKAGVNLVERERGRLLNRVNCECQTPVFLRAIVLPSAAAKSAAAQAANPSATVSMYVGSGCDNPTLVGCCLKLGSTPLSLFRISGLTSETTVNQLTRPWSTVACGQNAVYWATGTGGATGAGGAGGGSGAGGTGGGAGTGGATGTTSTGPCLGTQLGQTLWVLIGATGDGSSEIARATLGFNVDTAPPPVPANVLVTPAHEALIVNWKPVETATAVDILGYQLMCTRGDRTQVFKDGTFTAGFDSCATELSTDWPQSPPAKSAFVCSDLLSTSTSSARLKILENNITYGVGVVAIDRQGNASVIQQPDYKAPLATRDFYYDYRHGEPQGSAVGGFCAVSGVASAGVTASVLGALGALALAVSLGRRRSRGGKGKCK